MDEIFINITDAVDEPATVAPFKGVHVTFLMATGKKYSAALTWSRNHDVLNSRRPVAASIQALVSACVQGVPGWQEVANDGYEVRVAGFH